MARRRFIAPARGEVPDAVFMHPIFTQVERFRELITMPAWPSIEQINALPASDEADAALPRFVLQDDMLLADGLHYEARIHEHGQIATRSDSWHDLFNAIVWRQHHALKSALNARQCAEVLRIGAKARSRAQDALTQFDEAGVVVVLRDDSLLELWDEHDWTGLFWREREAWHDGRIEVIVFGHALYEHALLPEVLLVGKCLVVHVNASCSEQTGSGVPPLPSTMRGHASGSMISALAQAIADDRLLNDPAELRPLPLSGIPGWHPRTDEQAFYRDADCFRSRRADRRYPKPLSVPL